MKLLYKPLQELQLPRNKDKEHHKSHQHPKDAKKPRHTMGLLAGDFDVHTPKRGDQMHGDKDGRQDRDLTDDLIDVQTHPQIGGTQMRQTIRLRAPDDLVEMRQVRHRRHQMVLHVTEVQEKIAVGEHRVLVLCLAALHEPIEHVALAIETVDQVGDFLAEVVDPWDEDFGVVDPRDEHLVFDGFGFEGRGAHERFEAVDYVVAVGFTISSCPYDSWKRGEGDVHQGIADPVAGQHGRILHFANPGTNPINMDGAARGKGDRPIVEDQDVELGRGRIPLGLRIRHQDPERNEVVGAENLDLLPFFAQGDILSGQRVDVKGVGDRVHVFLGRVVDVQPPSIAVGLAPLLRQRKVDGRAGKEAFPGIGGFGGLHLVREVAEAAGFRDDLLGTVFLAVAGGGWSHFRGSIIVELPRG